MLKVKRKKGKKAVKKRRVHSQILAIPAKTPCTPHPGGRPTVYSQDTVVRAEYYLKNYRELGNIIPQMAGLALWLGVCRDTLYAWAQDADKAEFSDVLKNVLAAQEVALIDNGLAGSFNSTIAKLILSKHGYFDRVDNVNYHPNGKPSDTVWNITPVEPAPRVIEGEVQP